MTGPVQVVVVGFDRPEWNGEVLAELARLRDAGTVRLLDLLLVERTEDGALVTLPFPEGSPSDLGVMTASLLGASADDDVQVEGASWSLADAIPVGTTAAVALIEHLWAEPLREAITRSGGTPLDEAWLHRDDVVRLEGLLA
ncbi:MAG TPA: DUF6325 family protein [Nocardioides sp.]|uniref:DUF6325 family protein n=1 Tax=uncultured Nocardioides sp. TaxID=198441 RepID=UPI000ED73708|nr:DUF6325 family protein [uncultured Nocardioides sp.]HCB06439.1 hypothetical protein [Nocardioides sp.]HRD60428.1 DUF6325 family protein [Nocardioides sp.]HRI97286.1 DUF6325 family protein [Nocardioides sp.]HRK46922.1 DUF6325 family protein [Nocardioides sp.]